MLQREKDIESLYRMIKVFPVTAILGARQVGKSTLAKQLNPTHFFDLENPEDFLKFQNPQFFLNELSGLIAIDEVQRMPDLFPLLRFQSDTNVAQKFLLLGSASTSLMKNSSETLAGRIGYHYLGGFTLADIGTDFQSLWLKGGFPRSFLLEITESKLWRENFISTFLERDIPQLGINIASTTMRRFWTMLAHYHGQVLNYTELSRSFGVSDMTIRKYLEVLEGTFMVRLLQPWHANVSKRLVKAPKLYITDTGLLHTLLTIRDIEQLLSHPKLGASWEGFCIEQAVRILNKRNEEVFFYATHAGAEIDLFWQEGGKNFALEVKFTDTPSVTKSMRVAIADLQIAKTWIVYPGASVVRLAENIEAIPVTMLERIVTD